MSDRPQIAGDDAGPTSPFPYRMEGKVISGFGRGSKELGIPTANLPVDESLTPWISSVPSGVYFGYASLHLDSTHPQSSAHSSSSGRTTTKEEDSGGFSLFPMVMSIGYNPFYKNTVRSAEVHILHAFARDFYDSHMRLLIVGFIREEKDYKSLEALVEDINMDCVVARNSLRRDKWAPPAAAAAAAGETKEEEGGREKIDGQLDVTWLMRPMQ